MFRHTAIFERGTAIYSLRRKIRLVVARKPQGAVGIFEPVVFPTIKEKAKLKRLLGNASASSPSLSVVRLSIQNVKYTRLRCGYEAAPWSSHYLQIGLFILFFK